MGTVTISRSCPAFTTSTQQRTNPTRPLNELIDGAMNELHQCRKPQCRRIYNLLKVRNGKKEVTA